MTRDVSRVELEDKTVGFSKEAARLSMKLTIWKLFPLKTSLGNGARRDFFTTIECSSLVGKARPNMSVRACRLGRSEQTMSTSWLLSVHTQGSIKIESGQAAALLDLGIEPAQEPTTRMETNTRRSILNASFNQLKVASGCTKIVYLYSVYIYLVGRGC